MEHRRNANPRSKKWEAPILAGYGSHAHVWDVRRCNLVRSEKPPIVCRCEMEVVERATGEWLECHTNFHLSAFEKGAFVFEDRDALLLHARLHVRQFLDGIDVPRPRSCGEWPVVFDCTGLAENEVQDSR